MTPHWHCQIQLHLKRRKFDWWALFRDIYGDGSMCLVIRALPAGKILYIVYGYPLVVGILTLLLYPVLKKKFQNSEKVIISLFAAAAVSSYYWFRLSMLFGFSPMHSNGTLINLTAYLP